MSEQAAVQTVTVTIHFPRADPGPAHTARMLALLKFVADHDGQVTDADVSRPTTPPTAEPRPEEGQ